MTGVASQEPGGRRASAGAPGGGSRRLRALVGVVLYAVAVGVNVRLERTGRGAAAEHSLYLPSARYLKHATLGFRSVAADFLYVWSIQYYSTSRRDRWRHLPRFYDAITNLNPRFQTAYSIGALILALEAGDRTQALALLDKGIRQNPETYFLAWEAAMHARDMGEFDRQLAYLRLAMSKPDAPFYVRHWYNYALARKGSKEEALRLWQETYHAARSERERRVAARYVRDLTLELDLEKLRTGIAGFRERFGRPPSALDELVRAGELAAVPVNPEGQPYVYDRVHGEVSFSGESFRERLQ